MDNFKKLIKEALTPDFLKEDRYDDDDISIKPDFEEFVNFFDVIARSKFGTDFFRLEDDEKEWVENENKYNYKKYLNEEEYHPQKKYSMGEVKREIDLAVQQGEALLKYQMGDYGEVGEYEAWESLKEDLIELHQQSVIENVEGFTGFVDNNDGNDLPNRSSGSFMTGILDIDGLLGALNFEEQDHKGYDLYSQEEWDEAVAYWTSKTQRLNSPKYD